MIRRRSPRSLLLLAAYQREAPTGGGLCKKQLYMFWQDLNILRKKAKFKFKIVEIDQPSVFLLHN
jgi:hypothetical protein